MKPSPRSPETIAKLVAVAQQRAAADCERQRARAVVARSRLPLWRSHVDQAVQLLRAGKAEWQVIDALTGVR